MILCCWRDLQQLHDSVISENELIKRPVTSENVRSPPPLSGRRSAVFACSYLYVLALDVNRQQDVGLLHSPALAYI